MALYGGLPAVDWAPSSAHGAPPRRFRHSNNTVVWGETCNDETCSDFDQMLPDYWSAEDQQRMARMASQGSSRSTSKSGYSDEPSLGTSLFRLVETVGTYFSEVADALTSDAGGEFINGAGSALLLQGDPVQGKRVLGVSTSTDVGRKKSE